MRDMSVAAHRLRVQRTQKGAGECAGATLDQPTASAPCHCPCNVLAHASMPDPRRQLSTHAWLPFLQGFQAHPRQVRPQVDVHPPCHALVDVVHRQWDHCKTSGGQQRGRARVQAGGDGGARRQLAHGPHRAVDERGGDGQGGGSVPARGGGRGMSASRGAHHMSSTAGQAEAGCPAQNDRRGSTKHVYCQLQRSIHQSDWNTPALSTHQSAVSSTAAATGTATGWLSRSLMLAACARYSKAGGAPGRHVAPATAAAEAGQAPAGSWQAKGVEARAR